MIIDEDREKARRVGLRGQRFFIESLNQWAAGTPAPDVESWGDDLTSVSDDGKMVVTIGSENIEVDFSTPSGPCSTRTTPTARSTTPSTTSRR